jgi:hypothetical protein
MFNSWPGKTIPLGNRIVQMRHLYRAIREILCPLVVLVGTALRQRIRLDDGEVFTYSFLFPEPPILLLDRYETFGIT